MELPKGLARRGGAYYADTRRGGKRVRKSLGTDLDGAIHKLEEMTEQKVDEPLVLFESLVDPYLKHLRTYAKKKSAEVAESSLRILLRFFRGKDVMELCSEDLEHFIEARRQQVKDVSINKDLRNLRSMLNFAVDTKRIVALPVKVKLLKVLRKNQARVFTRGEIARLLDAADERTKALLLIAASTGFRSDELLHLKWSDIDFAESKISVTAKEGWTPKSFQERFCYVPTNVIEYLRTFRKTLTYAADDDWVFQSRKREGQRLTNILKPLRETFKAAGLYRRGKLTHELRKTVCSTLFKNGVDLEAIRQIMGHSSYSVTMLYANTTEKQLRDAAGKLNLT